MLESSRAGSLQPSLFESKNSQWGPGAARTFCCFLFSLYNIAEKITRSFTHSRLWVPFLFTHPRCVKCFNRFSISPSAIIVIPLTWNLLLPTLCSLTLIYSLCSVRAKQKKKPVQSIKFCFIYIASNHCSSSLKALYIVRSVGDLCSASVKEKLPFNMQKSDRTKKHWKRARD